VVCFFSSILPRPGGHDKRYELGAGPIRRGGKEEKREKKGRQELGKPACSPFSFCGAGLAAKKRKLGEAALPIWKGDARVCFHSFLRRQKGGNEKSDGETTITTARRGGKRKAASHFSFLPGRNYI